MKVVADIILAACIVVALVVGLGSLGRSGSHSRARAPKQVSPSYTSCREYAGAPAKAGSVYYSYKGISINLPAGATCVMPDGATFGADR